MIMQINTELQATIKMKKETQAGMSAWPSESSTGGAGSKIGLPGGESPGGPEGGALLESAGIEKAPGRR